MGQEMALTTRISACPLFALTAPEREMFSVCVSQSYQSFQEPAALQWHSRNCCFFDCSTVLHLHGNTKLTKINGLEIFCTLQCTARIYIANPFPSSAIHCIKWQGKTAKPFGNFTKPVLELPEC